ncbi:hypothetical protein M878_31300 [Streptomyces roseochromogenus subsp. oscitans DS 12.976]|uniref:Tetracycline repressor TetR C-terminal domain-containing protein n=1 Tax=Streptomyces roseochromogenus subsp. oscitans DS 12.976 TaxID=1352936 RepID=V6JWJ4_STRRC|nr:hypothetical protein M878_31300 [Streptomyces roseochromogenus subsp. oscitans DS 12.976]
MHGYRAIWYHTADEIAIRTTATHRRTTGDRPTHRDRDFTGPDPTELPRLAEVAERWAPLTPQATYAHGLTALVEGLLTTRN